MSKRVNLYRSMDQAKGVVILALLKRPNEPVQKSQVILVRQYRPPLDALCLELPAGLIDQGETAEQAALRELKEETGYHGTISSTATKLASLVVYNDPGLTNANSVLVTVEIDLDDTVNQDPRPRAEDAGTIQTMSVGLENLLDHLHVQGTEGVAVDARLYHLAQGISLFSSMSQ